MTPITPTMDQAKPWAGQQARLVTIGGPAEGPDVIPCPALVTFPDGPGTPPVIRVAWALNELELAALAQGGELWLSSWGGLPIHQLEVQPGSRL